MQQQRLDMQEARALRAEQRQLQLDQEARDQRVIENKYKASADLRAETQMGINLDANERAAQQEQRAADDAFYKQYGITDALAVDMPTGLNQRDQPAVQAAWEQVRKAGRAAMQSTKKMASPTGEPHVTPDQKPSILRSSFLLNVPAGRSPVNHRPLDRVRRRFRDGLMLPRIANGSACWSTYWVWLWLWPLLS